MILFKKFSITGLLLVSGLTASTAQVARHAGTENGLSYYQKWMVVSTYADGSDTLYYQDGRNGSQRLSSWENCVALHHPEVSVIVDHHEKTILLIPDQVLSGKAPKPIRLHDSVWTYLEPGTDTAAGVYTDSLITLHDEQADISIYLDPVEKYADRIRINFRPDVNQNPEEEGPASAEWILIQRTINPKTVDSLVNIKEYIIKSGNQWKATAAFGDYEFINLINENTD